MLLPVPLLAVLSNEVLAGRCLATIRASWGMAAYLVAVASSAAAGALVQPLVDVAGNLATGKAAGLVEAPRHARLVMV